MSYEELSQEKQDCIVMLATSGLATWEGMSESDKAEFINIEEFLGTMIFMAAGKIIVQDE